MQTTGVPVPMPERTLTRFSCLIIAPVRSPTWIPWKYSRQFHFLQQQFALSNSHLSYHLQLRHAFQAQFGTAIVSPTSSVLEPRLRNDAQTKPFSTIYKAPLPFVHKGLDTVQSRWREKVSGLEGKVWEDLWDYPMSQLVSARDHLIHAWLT